MITSPIDTYKHPVRSLALGQCVFDYCFIGLQSKESRQILIKLRAVSLFLIIHIHDIYLYVNAWQNFCSQIFCHYEENKIRTP